MELYKIGTSQNIPPKGVKEEWDLPANLTSHTFAVGGEEYRFTRDSKAGRCQVASRGHTLWSYPCESSPAKLLIGHFDHNDASDFGLIQKNKIDIFYLKRSAQPWWTVKPDFYRLVAESHGKPQKPIQLPQVGVIEKFSLVGTKDKTHVISYSLGQAGGGILIRSLKPFGMLEFQFKESRRDLHLGWVFMGVLENETVFDVNGIKFLTLTPSEANQEFFLSQVRTPEF